MAAVSVLLAPLAARRLVPAAEAGAAAQSQCTFTLGFATLREAVGSVVVGDCLESERFVPASGNSEQRTTRGLLVWRKADNWTAFTDGYRTWISGPDGIVDRLNDERFAWEADAGAAPTPAPTASTPGGLPSPTPGLPAPTPVAAPTATPSGVPLLAAGDVGGCSTDLRTSSGATARILDAQPGTIAALGDLAYESGTLAEFRCYDLTWGRHKARTRPVPGNHEYLTPGAAGYFAYFGDAAADPTKGYYSYRLGEWLVLALNSNCDVVACRAGSPQERWVRETLAANPTRCALAYMHHPRFSSGEHGSDATFQPLWQALYDGGADLVLAGHDHNYERFAPQDPAGRLDPARGLREFVVGTGGGTLRDVPRGVPNSEVRGSGVLGVLRLALRPTGYDWEFLPAFTTTFKDSGSASCA